MRRRAFDLRKEMDKELGPVPLSDGQKALAEEIEALSDKDASEAYAALISIVHQMVRLDAGLGKPVALDDIEVFAASFESWVNRLDELSDVKLHAQYETIRRGSYAATNEPSANVRYGAQAMMVILLGEMVRRHAARENRHDTSGYERAVRMLSRLERSL
jgi:hypothetical protein